MPEMTIEKTKEYLVVKIPLKTIEKQMVDIAIDEGLEDIKAGRVFGPFKNVKEFKRALGKSKSRR